MKKIFITTTILLQFSLNAQWTDNGNNTTTMDNVGIGITSPNKELHIYSSTSSIIRTQLNSYFSEFGQNPSGGFLILTDNSGTTNSLLRSYGHTYLNTSTGNVGIGTTSPDVKLHIHSPASAILRISNGNYYSEFGQNTAGGYLKIMDNSGATNSLLRSYGDTYLNANTGNVGIGTASPDAKLAVNGNIHTKEVKVDLVGWPDYVFKKEYNLPSLEEVETHIEEKGHLQNIPSAQEVEENGIKLGEMNSKLLQKIEELMLYTIQQEKKIKMLESRLENLESNQTNQ